MSSRNNGHGNYKAPRQRLDNNDRFDNNDQFIDDNDHQFNVGAHGSSYGRAGRSYGPGGWMIFFRVFAALTFAVAVTALILSSINTHKSHDKENITAHPNVADVLSFYQEMEPCACTNIIVGTACSLLYPDKFLKWHRNGTNDDLEFYCDKEAQQWIETSTTILWGIQNEAGGCPVGKNLTENKLCGIRWSGENADARIGMYIASPFLVSRITWTDNGGGASVNDSCGGVGEFVHLGVYINGEHQPFGNFTLHAQAISSVTSTIFGDDHFLSLRTTTAVPAGWFNIGIENHCSSNLNNWSAQIEIRRTSVDYSP